MSRNRLQIGELARMLDVTPKAIRHYHKLGLLPKPQRAGNGYRLYAAETLLQLQRIRRLQAIGFSLQQIKLLLEAKQPNATLQEYLHGLLAEITVQQQRLAERRTQLETLLQEEEILQAATTITSASPIFDRLQEKLSPLFGDTPPTWLEQERQILGQLEELHLLEGQEAGWTAAADYVAAHPEEYKALLAWGEKLAEIADLPSDAPQIEELARAYSQSEAQAFMMQVQQKLAQATETQVTERASAAMFTVAGETLPLTGAQRRFFVLVEKFTTQ